MSAAHSVCLNKKNQYRVLLVLSQPFTFEAKLMLWVCVR